MTSKRHLSLLQPYEIRADQPDLHPLARFLFHLIALKRTNLCVSADVTSTAELLAFAEEVGDFICVLKTHADIISDFGERTIRGLRDVASRRKFIIFEDRKFGDIGSTVQKQYTSGPLNIIRWAPLTNAHVFPGPAVVRALKEAAQSTMIQLNQSVSTEISAGTRGSSFDTTASWDPEKMELVYDSDKEEKPDDFRRKGSIVSTTTITTQYETKDFPSSPGAEGRDELSRAQALLDMWQDQFERGLLILAEMSSAGNMMTGTYTQRCVEIAREHRDFVLGFVAQRCLNTLPGDNFIVFTPGVSLPPIRGDDSEGEASHPLVDGLGQQYNTPESVIFDKGCDVIIVGRAIINAPNRAKEAMRYRDAAWGAYERRLATEQ